MSQKKTWFYLPIFLMFLAIGGCKHPATENESQLPLNVFVEPVGDLRHFSKQQYLGFVRAWQRGDISFEVPGKIDKLTVDIGSRVSKGEVLASLVDSEAKISVAEAVADVSSARLDLENASIEWQRHQTLFRDELVSATDVDLWYLRKGNAEARLKVAEARCDMAFKKFNDTLLLAPFDGIIHARFAQPGEVVGAGQTILSTINPAMPFEVVTAIPEYQISADLIGMSVSMTVKSDRQIMGKIKEINGKTDEHGLVDVIIDVDEKYKSHLVPGIPVDVAINVHHKAGSTLIPTSSLINQTGIEPFAVWVVNPKTSTVSKRVIHLLKFYHNDMVVDSGLMPGEIVVVKGARQLTEGQTISALSLQHSPIFM